MAASGFAGLGYQVVWTQQFGLTLGHESAAVLAVVTAFFGGLSLGAGLLGRRIEASPQPQRWYAACEAVIGGWGALLLWLLPAAGPVLLDLIGPDATPLRHWGLAFAGSFALLLPATVAMGATLPAMARLGTTDLAPLYAANTAGAVTGVLATAFWLIPTWGLSGSAALCVVLNLGCAALSWALLRPAPAEPAAPPSPAAGLSGDRWPLLLLALTGLLGIAYEVLAVRVISQLAEDTVYTFALLLAVYLGGTTLGAAAFARWPGLRNTPDLLQALALSVLLGMGAMWQGEEIKAWIGPESLLTAIAAEACLATAVFAMPTLLMGALFCQLSAEAERSGHPFSRALAVNTLGAMLAAPVFGVGLIALMGPKAALLSIAAGYLLLAPEWRSGWWLVPAGITAVLALWGEPLRFVDVPEDGQLLSYRDGSMAAVSVVADAQGVASLRINNRAQEGSNATVFVDGRQALLPLLLHGQPRRALFLGVGSGVTSGVAARYPGVQVDAVELLPEVIEATSFFRPALGDGPMPHLIAADARRFVRSTPERYDVIVSDNFHPARSGSGALYTVEHFRAVQTRLNEAGLFCQWLPLHQLDLATLRSITASFLAAFPDGAAILASNSLSTPTIGLVGRRGGTRFARHTPDPMARRFGLPDDLAVLGSLLADTPALARFSQGAVLNTDDRPWVAYRAPRITYQPDSTPSERLLELLSAWQLNDPPLADASFKPAVAAYARARQPYLALGARTPPSRDPVDMLSRTGPGLLEVLRLCPDFRPAAEPLRRLAADLDKTHPATAGEIRASLARIRADLAEP